MATNYIQEGKSMYLVTITGAESGDAFVVGDYLPCVLLTDADADDSHKATVATGGVFKLNTSDTDGNIGIGDMLYWTNKDTPLSKATAQKAFGIALEVNDDGENEILVMLTPKATVPASVDTGDLAANAVTSDKMAESLLRTIEISLSAAEIKTLYSANSNKGFEIVEAPGDNKFIEFVSATLHYDYDGSNAFTAANGLTFNVEDKATSALVANTLLQATADRIAVAEALSTGLNEDAADVLNKPLFLQEGSENPAGDSSEEDQLKVRVTYRIHDLA